MNMYQEVAQSLVSFSRSAEDNSLTAEYYFDKKRVVFKGHFPQMPILPGVMQLEMVRQVVEKATDSKLRIAAVKKAKFMEQVLPENRITLTIKLKEQGDTLHATAVISVSPKTVGKISLELKGSGKK